MLKAFCTGSRVYGQSRHDSDLDFVVLVDGEDLVRLQELAMLDENVEATGYPGQQSASLRFGKLNLIAVTNPELFLAWKDGTDACIRKYNETMDESGWPQQLTREEAVEIISEYRKARGFEEPSQVDDPDDKEDLPNA